MRPHYVLIDHENLQPDDLSALDREHFQVRVFVGANRTKLAFEFAAALQRMGGRADYIKISGNGPNALDFHIAFYIGQLAAKEPDAYFHIISKDTGFDPLIEHPREKKISVKRSCAITEISCAKAGSAKSLVEKLDVIIANLQQRKTSRPRSLKTLAGTINAMFQKQLSEAELASLLETLRAKGFITVEGAKVTYSPDPAAP